MRYHNFTTLDEVCCTFTAYIKQCHCRNMVKTLAYITSKYMELNLPIITYININIIKMLFKMFFQYLGIHTKKAFKIA